MQVYNIYKIHMQIFILHIFMVFYVATIYVYKMWAVISSTAIFVAIDNNTLYGSKLLISILCQKSLDIKIMFHDLNLLL